MEINKQACCGTRELHLLPATPKFAVLQIADDRFDEYEDWVFAIFTDAVHRVHGKRLAKFIKDNKLGTVTATPIRENPNSWNPISVWVWGMNHKRLAKFWENNKHDPDYLKWLDDDREYCKCHDCNS